MESQESYNILIGLEVQDIKVDTGLNYRVMCLCREHHDEADNCISRMDFMKKYHLAGIYLSPEQVKELKKVYKGHFQAFKEEK